MASETGRMSVSVTQYKQENSGHALPALDYASKPLE